VDHGKLLVSVGYNPIVARGLVGISVAIIAVSVMMSLSVIAMVPSLVFGLIMMSRESFSVYERAIVFSALIGPRKIVHSFQSVADLKFEGNKLYLSKSGKQQKLPVLKFMANPKAWEQLKQLV
jgi:hypothetical protein